MPLENYHIIQSISKKKQFGRLYLAEEKSSNKKVVVKSVSKEDIRAYERLLNEAQWSFEEKGLPKIIEKVEDDTSFVLIKDFVDGEPIDIFFKRLKKNQVKSFLLRFTIQLDKRLKTIHSKGLVHCDIKPGNILISGNLDSFDVHLIDFGLAINTNDVEERSMLFPLGYAAPELLLNRLELVNPQTDIFSVGILFWRLIVGKLPLVHPNPSIFTNLQLTHPLPEHSDIKGKLFQILTKLSHKHEFALPPNRMNYEEVNNCLLIARNERPTDLRPLIDYFETEHSRRFKLW